MMRRAPLDSCQGEREMHDEKVIVRSKLICRKSACARESVCERVCVCVKRCMGAAWTLRSPRVISRCLSPRVMSQEQQLVCSEGMHLRRLRERERTAGAYVLLHVFALQVCVRVIHASERLRVSMEAEGTSEGERVCCCRRHQLSFSLSHSPAAGAGDVSFTCCCRMSSARTLSAAAAAS